MQTGVEKYRQANHRTAAVVQVVEDHHALRLLAERSIANTGLCLSDFGALEALLHKGPLTITEIQDKVMLASGSSAQPSTAWRKWD